MCYLDLTNARGGVGTLKGRAGAFNFQFMLTTVHNIQYVVNYIAVIASASLLKGGAPQTDKDLFYLEAAIMYVAIPPVFVLTREDRAGGSTSPCPRNDDDDGARIGHNWQCFSRGREEGGGGRGAAKLPSLDADNCAVVFPNMSRVGKS